MRGARLWQFTKVKHYANRTVALWPANHENSTRHDAQRRARAAAAREATAMGASKRAQPKMRADDFHCEQASWEPTLATRLSGAKRAWRASRAEHYNAAAGSKALNVSENELATLLAAPVHVVKEGLTAAVWGMDTLQVACGSEADRVLNETSPTGGLFLVHGFRHTREYLLHAHMLHLSASDGLVNRSSILLYANNHNPVGGPAMKDLVGYLAYYPQRLRLLIHSRVNAGYRCGEMYSLAASSRVWMRFPWVVRTNPDIYLTPTAIARLGRLLAAKESTPTTELWVDEFPHSSLGDPKFSMDYYMWRPRHAVGPSWWENATALCTRSLIWPEALLAVLARLFAIEWRFIGGTPVPTYYTASAQMNVCGFWHTHNCSAVEAWLRTHDNTLHDREQHFADREAKAVRRFRSSRSCCSYTMHPPRDCPRATTTTAMVSLGAYLQ